MKRTFIAAWVLLAGCGSGDSDAAPVSSGSDSGAAGNDSSAAGAAGAAGAQGGSAGGGTDGGQDVVQESASGDGAIPDGPADAVSEGTKKAPWLISIDDTTSPTRLLKIDTATGTGKALCSLKDPYNGQNYNSSTFGRDNALYASNATASRIDIIHPCTCDVTVLGATGMGPIPGITVDQGQDLFGIEVSQDVLVKISTLDGVAHSVGALGVDFGTAGATWSDAIQKVYAINGTTGRLHLVDPVNGAASQPGVQITGMTFGSVGVELHPANGTIYACTDDAVLYAIDPQSGKASAIGGGMGHGGACDNLAANWKQVPCVDTF
jgi:hypothetical protein